MKVYLDNILVSSPSMTESLKNPTFTLRRKDENEDTAFGFTDDLVFTGKEYTYLFAKLKTDPNAINNEVELKFVNDCCTTSPQTYLFKITHQSLQWCENECELTAAAVEKLTSSAQKTCLNNTMIWDNYNGFQAKAHPRMSYCNELRPNWMSDVILILGIIIGFLILVLTPILFVIGIIVAIINGIITVLNTLPGVNIDKIDFDGDPSTNVFQEMKNFRDKLFAFIVGCGRKHPSPLVRDYATNVCQKCGLQFVSSIYNNPTSPYYNTVYVNAPINKGTQEADNTTFWIDGNKPILNGVMFFDKLKAVTNSKWIIKNNVLYFERRDKFNPGGVWLDLTSIPVERIKRICWKFSSKTHYSYANFEYMKDPISELGNESAERWNDIIEWNSPYSPLQKGEFKPLIEFTTCRFRDDGIDRDVLSAYKYAPFIGPIIQRYGNVMLLQSHVVFNPMLLIWDPNTGVYNGKVDPTAVFFGGYPGVSANQFYNYPFWFNENYPDNLYHNFYDIDNPKIQNFKGLDFVAEIYPTCAELTAVDIDGSINTSEGLCEDIKDININFKENLLIISGTV